ncbi:unnamed protein product [Miscanthus lutarioriparius]|uniref:Uncharacterized protein n=1 Tax=Miscanthus lutarioriparius TaxID=422564 RepID=A0A811SS00_9POAL|nr:unnamed protein product [Miscanthus lutarioriparius]
MGRWLSAASRGRVPSVRGEGARGTERRGSRRQSLFGPARVDAGGGIGREGVQKGGSQGGVAREIQEASRDTGPPVGTRGFYLGATEWQDEEREEPDIRRFLVAEKRQRYRVR